MRPLWKGSHIFFGVQSFTELQNLLLHLLPTLGPPLIIFELLNDFSQISLNIEVTTMKYKKNQMLVGGERSTLKLPRNIK